MRLRGSDIAHGDGGCAAERPVAGKSSLLFAEAASPILNRVGEAVIAELFRESPGGWAPIDQYGVGTWLSASILDLAAGDEARARLLVAAGLAAALAALAGSADWSEQDEQQMRVGVVHTAGNAVAVTLYGASLASRSPRLSRALRLSGLAVISVSGCSVAISRSGWPAAPIMPSARGPATAPQPALRVREVGGAIQVCLPGAG